MPKRILVIDDDSTVSGLLYTHLSSEGYEVSVTSLAEQGFTEATQNPPSLILLDVQLPDATGFQVVGRLRSNPITRDVPIIMMSGAARFPSQQSVGRSMGANDYVLKPFEIAKISEKIQKLLQDAPDLAPSAQTPKPPATPVAENPVPSDPVKDELPQWIKPIPELKTEPEVTFNFESEPKPMATPPAQPQPSYPPVVTQFIEKAQDVKQPPQTAPAPGPASFHAPTFAEAPGSFEPHAEEKAPNFVPVVFEELPSANADAPGPAESPARVDTPAPIEPTVEAEPQTERSPSRPPQRAPWIAAAAVALAAAAWGVWHHFQQPAIDLPVQVASMTSGNSYFSIPGKVVPARTDTVNAPFGGPIVKHFREGQRVAEGELLATIGRANIAGDHEIARRALIAAQRESIRASKELSDSNSLPADLVRPEEVARDKRRVARAEQKLAVAQATYAREQARWKDNRVRAPYAGVIVQDKVGAQSSINEAAPIAVLSSGSEQLFVASINGPDGARLHIGQTAQVHISGNPNSLPATLDDLHSVLKQGAIHADVTLHFADPKQLRLAAETPAEANFVADDGKPVITVPSAAIVRRGSKNYIWIVNALDQLSLHEIRVGDSVGDRTTVTHGMSSGDRYSAVAGANLQPGMRVRPALSPVAE